MIKKSELFFTTLKLPLDYTLLIISGILAYWLRLTETVTNWRPVTFGLQLSQIIEASALVGLLGIFCLALAGSYSFRRLNITTEMSRIILGCATTISGVIIYLFFWREQFDSRFIILFAWGIAIVLLLIGRIILRIIQTTLLNHGVGSHRVLLVGSDHGTAELKKYLQENSFLGYQVVQVLKNINEETLAEIEKLHHKKFIDEIIQADSTISRHDSLTLLDFAEEHNIIFKYTAGTFEARATNIEVHLIGGLPLVEIRKTKLDGWGKIAKRLLDLLISFLLLIILSPILIIIAILIKLESRGPIIFKNERVGRRGNFMVYKFRSMYRDFCIGPQFNKNAKALEIEKELIKKSSERQGPVYKILKDPRRTIIGRFIEKTSIDELPQLFNVLIGNMSLVGPRPHQPREVEKYSKGQRRVLDIKPGITGLAQISGRSDLDFEEEVKLDTYYIENWSLRLDIWIILKTPLVILTRKSKV